MPGVAEVASVDYPRVRVWPPFYSRDGFAAASTSNVPLPEPKGEKSRGVLVSGQVKMGRAVLYVGLGPYADEAGSMRHLTVKGERWPGVIGVTKARQPVGAH